MNLQTVGGGRGSPRGSGSARRRSGPERDVLFVPRSGVDHPKSFDLGRFLPGKIFNPLVDNIGRRRIGRVLDQKPWKSARTWASVPKNLGNHQGFGARCKQS